MAEATSGWNVGMQMLIGVMVFGPLWLVYEIAVTYLPGLGTRTGVVNTPLGSVFLVGVLLVLVLLVADAFYHTGRGVGRFMLAGAFSHPRKIYSLAVLRIESKRVPRVWTLRCQAEGRELAVVVTARRERLRAALELAGQPVPTGSWGA